MAHKRMFSKDITTSDAFREMPASSQSLYFHLGMEADDDGFLDNYKGLMRSINASEDDLRVLIGKRFLILFPSKVVVVKHWRINNTIRLDRYSETKHLEEKRALIIKENGSYTEHLESGNQVATQYRIEENRKEEILASPITVQISKEEKVPKKESSAKYPHAKAIFALFDDYPKRWEKQTPFLVSAESLYEDQGIEELTEQMEWYKKNRHRDFCPQFDDPIEWSKKYASIDRFFDKVTT